MPELRFWVLGGEYTNLKFERMIVGTETVIGPIPSRERADEIWRELSDRNRPNAAMRFCIARELARTEQIEPLAERVAAIEGLPAPLPGRDDQQFGR